jgi:hypothetical protein
MDNIITKFIDEKRRRTAKTSTKRSGPESRAETVRDTCSSDEDDAPCAINLSSSERSRIGLICGTSSDTSDENFDASPSKKCKTAFGQRGLNEYFLKNEIMSEEQFFDMVRNKDDEAIAMYDNLMTRVHYNKMLMNAVSYARIRRDRRSLQCRLEDDDGLADPGDEVFRNLLAFVLAQEKFDRLRKLFNVLLGRCGKMNCFFAYGNKSTGKTSFISYFTSLYDVWEIGVVNPCETQSQFWLMDLVDKEIYIGDEFNVNPTNMDTCKLLFEGSDNLTVDVKYENKKRLVRQPILMASNNRLEDPILRARCEVWHFKKCNVNIHCEDKSRRRAAIRRLYDCIMK